MSIDMMPGVEQRDTFNGGFNYSIVGGQGNKNNFNIYNHELGAGLLCQHVAANAFFNSQEVSAQPKCHEGTRIAILEDLVSWAGTLPHEYRMKWLHGPAGSGKSTILRTIARMLFEQMLLMAGFFFFRSSAGRNSAEKFIPSIAYQLTLSIPATRPFIIKAIENDPLIFSASLEDQANPRIIIVDGLDECDDYIKQVEILQVLSRALQNPLIPFAILIASRPEPHIRSAFDLGQLNKISTRLSLDSDYQADDDIRKYLEGNFSAIRESYMSKSMSSLPPLWPSDDVINTLVANASGQFVYASTVIKFVSPPRYNPAMRLETLMKRSNMEETKPFEELDLLYAAIFKTVDPKNLHQTLLVLGALLLSPSHVFLRSPDGLEEILELRRGDVRTLFFDLESLLTIISDSEIIHFFHTSLSDYVLDSSRSGAFWIDAASVYTHLAKKCLPQDEQSWSSRTWLRKAWDEDIFFLFSHARPTSDLRETIEKCNFAHNHDTDFVALYRATLLLGIRKSGFPDAEQLYRLKLVQYAKHIEPGLQIYSKDAVARRFLIASMYMSPRSGSGAVRESQLHRTFGLSNSIISADKSSYGFNLTNGCPSSFQVVMKDLFDDPQGNFFIDENQYADTALHFMKAFTPGSQFYFPDHYVPAPMSYNVMAQSYIRQNFDTAFSAIILKSAIRQDLIEYIQEHSLASDTVKGYISRANDMEWSERVLFSLDKAIRNWVKVPADTRRAHGIWTEEDFVTRGANDVAEDDDLSTEEDE
ncbi:hypothetical protein CPB84DRAFT_1841106 [Gymnopilus junonius]|uniref:NACHT domain-containing protein n=1 Tax=Gymnopilus junonius TaxID=109634 RepID=A0A9P5NZI6_GYMJU|nr:hypothetical protein CPB84DRAFT_1841106 [Gymnopilus junonius]